MRWRGETMLNDEKTLHITDRDKEIFERLLQAKVLTGKQLLAAYFNGSTVGYRRLTMLCSSGYLLKEPYFEKLKSGRKRKIGNTYRLTQKGVDELRQLGLVEAKRPLRRIPQNEDLDFHIRLNNFLLGLNAKNALEAKKELHLKNYVPLCATAGDLHIFRVKTPYRPGAIGAILNAADKLPRSVVLCASKNARAALREKHRLGQVYALLEPDMDLIPRLVSDPLHYLRLLLDTVKRKDPRIRHSEPNGILGHYIEATVPEGTILIAETITGCLSTFRKIKNFEGDFYFILVKDKKSVSGLPFKNKPANVFLPDGTMFRADDSHDDTYPEAAEEGVG
jgi:DNA-binding PadR family transcriptional regulator